MLRTLLSRFEPSADRPATWEKLTNVSSEEAGANFSDGALALRVGKTAQAIVDLHGPRKSAALLNALRSRYAGSTFTVTDFIAVADSLDLPIAPLLDSWLRSTTLPRFVASSANVARLTNDAAAPRYRTRLHVYNEADVSGVVALSTDRYGSERTTPVVVAGRTSVELDWTSAEPPAILWLHSYLSANRHPFSIHVETTAQETAGDAFGARPSEWRPEPSPGLIVDDLDPGFSIEADDEENRWRFRLPDFAATPQFDQGLPVYGSNSSTLHANTWHREIVPSAWGRHRRTIALAKAGDGNARAVATVHLPSAGRWELTFHIPLPVPPNFPGNPAPPAHLHLLGPYDITLRTTEDETPIEFDGRRSAFGWNTLGTFELPVGDVELIVSNSTQGQVVVFDAIRWRWVGTESAS